MTTKQESPFTAEDLFNVVQNDEPSYNRIRSLAVLLRRALDSTAGNLAAANAAWHDDPEADDHAAFHAPAIEQFPQAVRDEAAVELIRRHLAILSEPKGGAA